MFRQSILFSLLYVLFLCVMAKLNAAEERELEQLIAINTQAESLSASELQQRYDKLLEIFSSSEDKSLVQYSRCITLVYRKGSDFDFTAEKHFKEVIEKYPESRGAALAMLALSRYYHLGYLKGNAECSKNKVDEAYRQVEHSFSSKYPEIVEEACLYRWAFMLASKQQEDIQKFLSESEIAIKKQNFSQLFYIHALDLRANAFMLLADLSEQNEQETFQIYKQLRDTFIAYCERYHKYNPLRDNSSIYWMIGSISEFKLGDLECASQYYNKLVSEYPHNGRVFTAQLALKRIDSIIKSMK